MDRSSPAPSCRPSQMPLGGENPAPSSGVAASFTSGPTWGRNSDAAVVAEGRLRLQLLPCVALVVMLPRASLAQGSEPLPRLPPCPAFRMFLIAASALRSSFSSQLAGLCCLRRSALVAGVNLKHLAEPSNSMTVSPSRLLSCSLRRGWRTRRGHHVHGGPSARCPHSAGQRRAGWYRAAAVASRSW